jgi:TPR repeat protein
MESGNWPRRGERRHGGRARRHEQSWLALYDGKGVARDYAHARSLFENRAPPSSEASAMNGLGAIYNEGDGVPRNTKLARQWFEKAAALGIPQAKQNLKGMRR